MNCVKRCLLIGINYTGTDSELNGCINDSINLKEFFIKHKYFDPKNIIMMNDKLKKNKYPTKKNIIRQLKLMIKFANENKNKKVLLFISYSGHGTFMTDKNGDEIDGQDEMLCPIDYNKSGFIVDDWLKKNFIDKLPSNVNLVMLIDACHSGTSMDLKYQYMLNNLNTIIVHEKINDSKCPIIMISGSRDSETSADAYLQDGGTKVNEYQGAMTAAFLSNYEPNITYKQLIQKMRDWLKKSEFTQVPQLTSGSKINIEDKFILSNY